MSNEEFKRTDTQLQKVEEYPVSFPIDYPQQQEEEINLRDYLNVLLRRKWTAITFFTVVVTTVLIATFLMKPVYRAAVTIKIDKENPNVLAFKDVYAVERVEDDYYQTQYKVLKSRSLAKRVIRSSKLDKNPEFAPKENPIENNPDNDKKRGNSRNVDEEGDQNIIDAFLSRVAVEPVTRSRLVKVSFDAYSSELSASVANTIARSYIDFNVESKFEATQQARDWLEKQIQDIKAKVENSEEKLNEYAAKNGIIFITGRVTDPKGGQGGEDIITKRLAELSTHLIQATSDRISREALYNESREGEAESNSIVLGNSLILAIKKDRAVLESEYSQLSRLYKSDYPKMVRLKEQIEQVKAQIDAETKKIVSGIKKDYEAAVKRENYLKSTIEKYKEDALKINEKMVQYLILKREVDTNKELYSGLLQRLKETGVSASLTTSNIQILDRAEVPRSPSKPNKRMNLLLSIMTGLFGGIGLAFFLEYLDNTVKSPDDLEKRIMLPSLGIVPYSSEADKESPYALIASEDKKSPLSEAYRSIGTYIQFSSAARPPKTMLITSPRNSEGKTTTAVNTAVTLAQSYGKGVIIDADMRKPRLHKIFDVDNSNGLSAFLTGNVEFGDSLIQRTKAANLDVIPSGIIPPNPSELLSSNHMRDLLTRLFPLYSFIIIDSPPVLGLSDALIISTITDGVIMVVKAGETPRDAAVQTRKLLQGVNAKILGVVLNGIQESDLKYGSYSYYYSYAYYYDEDNNSNQGSKKRGKKRDSV